MAIFLKRIELQGFKSFAGKTILDFPAKVVAIVGPNGSGKSNIIDALRWVLGEREAKKLRGDTLDKLIFAGSTKKTAVGLARVSLYFNNNRRIFPIDAEEVELVRKIDRSGASEFLWNGENTRLKDLIQILARAKLGSRGLTIVNQGESDIFVRSNPEERRKMIEEILGLKEFRLKKSISERRLASSLVNIEKVQAMIDELVPHLRLLRRQRTKFEKRSEIEEKLKLQENKYFSFHYHNLKEAIQKIEKSIRNLQQEQKQKEAEVKLIEKNLKEINEKSGESERIKQLRNDLNSFLNKKFALKENLGRLEAEIEFKKSASGVKPSLVELEKTIKDLIKDIEAMLELQTAEDIKERLKSWLYRFKKILRGEEALNSQIFSKKKELEKVLQEIDTKIKNLEKESERLTYIQEELNQEFRKEVEKLELEKNQLRRLEHDVQSAFFEKEKIELKMSELEREWRIADREISELQNLPKISEEIDSDDLERKILRLRGELAAIGEIDEETVREAKEKEERYEFLKKELNDLNGAISDLRNLIKELDGKIHREFRSSFKAINDEFNRYFRLMFGGGRAKLKLQTYKPPQNFINQEEIASDDSKVVEIKEEEEDVELKAGIEIDLNVPQKSLKGIEMLSGGEKSLVSLAALFALISVSPPPFLVLDEIDAALDEENARRFAELIKEFSKHTQFILITHNRATMEAADVLYGVTMGEDGISKILSLKLE